MIGLAALAAALSAIGVFQAVAGWAVVVRFARRPNTAGGTPRVTVLKPLHGDEPLLEEALGSICQQDYPVWQVVFGVQDGGDVFIESGRDLGSRGRGDTRQHGY